jgi:CRP-like cAMP-binding protein
MGSAAARTDRVPLGSLLRGVEPFSNVRSEWLRRAGKLFDEVDLDADQMLFRAGEPADAVYVVRSGQIAMFTDTRGKAVHLVARIGPAEMFGIVGTLGGSQRVSSARAVLPTRLLRLGRADLLGLLQEDSALGLRFTLAVVSQHTRNAASALELGNRREIRIRVGREVDLVVDHRKRVRTEVANLSRGGICLSGTPAACFPDAPTWYALHTLDGDLVLRFNGRVAWRRDNRTGLAFADRAPAHDLLVQGALRELLRGPEPEAPQTDTSDRPPLPASVTG